MEQELYCPPLQSRAIYRSQMRFFCKSDNCIKEDKIKEHVKQQNAKLGMGFMEKLNAEVERLIKQAVNRARKNDRSTVYERDL